MRLLLLTAETCPTFRADVAVLFGKYLPRYGVNSDIVAGRTPGHTGSVEWVGGECLLCDISGGQAWKYCKILLHGVRILLHADRRCYDAVQVRDMPVLAVFGLLAAKVKGLPFFYWMSFPMPEEQILRARERGLSAGWMKFLFPWVQGRLGRFLLYRVVLPRADHVFVQSERMQRDMMARGIAREKMTPVPMGVDMEAIEATEIRPSDDPRLAGRQVIVYLGTLDRARRIEHLFTMLALVRRMKPDALLVLVGDTADAHHRRWLEAQATAAGVAEHVLWTDWLPMHEGWRYVRSAEVGLSPFPRGFLLDSASPTKVQEYLALGIPVVCNDNPDQQAVIEATGAGRCVAYTAREFAEAVVDILNLEAAYRQASARRGKSYIRENRTYERIAQDLATAYLRQI